MADNDKQLFANGASALVGKTFEGINGKINITPAGLAAAAHRAGAPPTQKYLQAVTRTGISPTKMPGLDKETYDSFMWIETRLREFQELPYDGLRVPQP